MEKQIFIEKLLEGAKKAGFDAAEAYLSESSDFETAVHKGEITRYSVSDTLTLGFRALKDGKVGSASTQVLDDDAIEMLLRAAREAAELSEQADERFFSGSESYPSLPSDFSKLLALAPADHIRAARELEQAAFDYDQRIVPFDGCGVSTCIYKKRLVNTLGLDLSDARGYLGAYVFPLAKQGAQSSGAGRMAFAEDPDCIDYRRMASEAAHEAVSMLDAESIPSGKYRILLRNDVAATLLQTYSPLFSAYNAQKGLSLLKGREGERIAAPCVCILDDPHMQGSFSSRTFDGEGVATCKRSIVEAGKLNTLLHNLKTAAKQGVATTANATRAGASGPIMVAPSNFYFAPGVLSMDEMLSGAGDGVLITSLMGMHSGANTVSGDFSLGAKGYLIQNGKIARPVNQITIAGNYLSLLKDIEACGNDLYFSEPETSRFGSPTLLVSSLSVAGK